MDTESRMNEIFERIKAKDIAPLAVFQGMRGIINDLSRELSEYERATKLSGKVNAKLMRELLGKQRCAECGPVDDGSALYCVKCWESAHGPAVAVSDGIDIDTFVRTIAEALDYKEACGGLDCDQSEYHSTTQVLIRAIKNMRSSASVVSGGCAVVPCELTSSMLFAWSGTKVFNEGKHWTDYKAAYRALLESAPSHSQQSEDTDRLREFADEVKQLCSDFSDRHNRPYMGDVTAAIDGLYDQFCKETKGS